MVYLVYGIEEYIIKKQINALIKKQQINPKAVLEYDLTNTALSSVVDKVNVYDLFSSTNFIIANNFNKFLTKKQPNKQFQLEQLTKFINTDSENTLVLTAYDDKISDKEVFDLLEAKKQTIYCKKLTAGETKQLMFKAFENRNITVTPHVVEYLYKKVGTNIRGLISEINKLAITNEKITNELINDLIIPKAEDNIFSLVDAILNKDLEKAMSKYEDMIKSGTSPLAVLSLVGNEISLMSNIKLAKEWNVSRSDIAAKFKKANFMISKAAKKAENYSEADLVKITKEINELEFLFKTGQNNQQILIQLFLIKLIKGY